MIHATNPIASPIATAEKRLILMNKHSPKVVSGAGDRIASNKNHGQQHVFTDLAVSIGTPMTQ